MLCPRPHRALGRSLLLPTALQEERPYREEYFDLVKVQDGHGRRECRDHNSSEPWPCGDCDCPACLEEKLKNTGKPFLTLLRNSTRDRK